MEIYARLAKFLDDLPAGYPPTESGVELRILRKLFSAQQAQIFIHMSLIGDSPRVIAHRAGLSEDAIIPILTNMECQGLISSALLTDGAFTYSVNQFVIGFYEEQVNHVDRELAELFEEYFPALFERSGWTRLPQLRTVPVGASIAAEMHILPYEHAEALLNDHDFYAVRPCVCRQERAVLGHRCDKPMETCLSFDGAGRYTVRMGRGREITREEARAILRLAEQAGLVLQPANSKNPIAICACCGCCCGVLRGLKMHEKPAELAASAFYAQADESLCAGCGECLERCPMEAISLPEGSAVVDLDRCIGCGLCVSACPTETLTLVRKSPEFQPDIPRSTLHTYLRLSHVRGKLGKIASMWVKSKVDGLIVR